MDANIDGTPFSVLMDRAVNLKKAQTAHEREMYDAFPSFYAHTIWPNDDATKARKLDLFSERLAAANLIKEEGNVAFRDGRLNDAREKYETALSVFRFLENTNLQWKSEGIKDKYIKEVEYECKDDEEHEKINQFLIKCYNNIALASYKMKDYSLAVKACGHALVVDRKSAKALLIRAQALIVPKNSSVAEQVLARLDLQVVVKNNPSNREAKRLLHKLKNQMKTQRSEEKCAFKGLFDRGEIYSALELREQKEARRKCTEEDKINLRHRDINLGKQLVQVYESRGLKKEKEQLEQTLMHAQTPHEFDFNNPSTKMIRDAKDMGVDLKDPLTVGLLEKMRNERNDGIMPTSSDGRASEHCSALASSVFNKLDRTGFGRITVLILSGVVVTMYLFIFYNQIRTESLWYE